MGGNKKLSADLTQPLPVFVPVQQVEPVTLAEGSVAMPVVDLYGDEEVTQEIEFQTLAEVAAAWHAELARQASHAQGGDK